MFDLINIFEVFIPQLLQYPNAKDPLNTDAALCYLKNREEYNQKVRHYVKGFALRQISMKEVQSLRKVSCSSDKKTAVSESEIAEKQDDELSQLSLMDLEELDDIMSQAS